MDSSQKFDTEMSPGSKENYTPSMEQHHFPSCTPPSLWQTFKKNGVDSRIL